MKMEKAAMAGVGGSNGQWWQTLGVEGLLEETMGWQPHTGLPHHWVCLHGTFHK